MRSVGREFTTYQTATHAFRDKYFALPGDTTNAISIWGSVAGPATCYSNTAATGTATCNGNGDGMVSGYSNDAVAGYGNENYRFWQHLANAGLIEGRYSGRLETGGSVAGLNAPTSKYHVGAWFVDNYNNAGSNQNCRRNHGNFFQLANAKLSPESAWNVDVKYDDGKPCQGNVIISPVNSCTNAANGTILTTDYNLTVTTEPCTISFINAM